MWRITLFDLWLLSYPCIPRVNLVSHGQELQKFGLQVSVQAPFLDIVVSCGEAETDLRDGVLQPTFPQSSFVASRCVPNLKPTHKAKGP